MSQHQVEGGLRGTVGGCLTKKEWPQGVLFGKYVFDGFDLARS